MRLSFTLSTPFVLFLNNKANLCHFSSLPCRSNDSNKVFIFFLAFYSSCHKNINLMTIDEGSDAQVMREILITLPAAFPRSPD